MTTILSIVVFILSCPFSFSFLNHHLNPKIKYRLLSELLQNTAVDKDEFISVDRDRAWMKEANNIEYVVGQAISFESLGAIGLNISTDISSRNIIPRHLISGNDLFCNRELNMKQIEAIGFDMDWTLAQYNVEFDLLAYNGARDKLVNWLGYPKEVLDLQYQPDLHRRGCVVDKKRGNILKLDRHKYVRVAEHGLSPLTREQRHILYRQTFQDLQTFGGSEYVCMDTPFSLVDCCLFAQLVDLRDKMSGVSNASYEKLWGDMRKCVDRCHKDGVIKLVVAENPSKYITYDPNIFPMLTSFRKAGKKVFLLTNSIFDYTNVVMNYLESRSSGSQKNMNWANYFDVVIVGGNKPGFLMDHGSLPLFRVNPASTTTGTGTTKSMTEAGELSNIETDLPTSEASLSSFLSRGHIFQGGNANDLQRLLNLSGGDKVLYVGDHMYADILRSKRTLGWRTCLVVHELTNEILATRKSKEDMEELTRLRRVLVLLEGTMGSRTGIPPTTTTTSSKPISHEGSSGSSTSSNVEEEDSSYSVLKDFAVAGELAELKEKITQLQFRVDQAYHNRWGALFRAGSQQSRFGKQVRDYACLYTSRASNLGLVSPFRPFRPTLGVLPHDEYLDALSDNF